MSGAGIPYPAKHLEDAFDFPNQSIQRNFFVGGRGRAYWPWRILARAMNRPYCEMMALRHSLKGYGALLVISESVVVAPLLPAGFAIQVDLVAVKGC